MIRLAVAAAAGLLAAAPAAAAAPPRSVRTRLYLTRGRLDGGGWEHLGARVWAPDVSSARPVGTGVSHQVSLVRSPGGWALVSQLPTFARDVVAHLAPRLAGPWRPAGIVARLPDPGPGTFIYNAVVHPHLSRPARWTISYNVNATSAHAERADARLYRPRFVEVPRPG